MIFRRCEEGGPAERDAAGAGGAGPGRGVTRQQAQADPPTAASPVCPEINVPLNVAVRPNAAPPYRHVHVRLLLSSLPLLQSFF